MNLSRDMQLGMKALAVMLVVIVGAFWLRHGGVLDKKAEITAVFTESQLLAKGNHVIYRGVKIGKVKEIRLSPGNDLVQVVMAVDPGLHFPPQAAALIEPQSLMGDWEVQIISKSWHPELTFPRSPAPGVLPGAALSSLAELTSVASRFEADIDTISSSFTPAKVAALHRTVDDAEALSDKLRGMVGQRGDTLSRAGGGILASSQRVLTMTQNARALAAGMRDTLRAGASGANGGMVASARTASANLLAFSNQLTVMAGRSGAMIRSADGTLTSVQRMSENLGRTAAAMGPQAASAGATLENAQRAMRTLQQTLAPAAQDTGAIGRLLNDPAAYQQTLRAVTELRRMLEDIQAHPEKYIGKQ